MVYSVIKKWFILCVAGIALASTCSAAIEWTLHPAVYGDDGLTAPFVTAMVGSNEITYVPPTQWMASGARVFPPAKIEADGYFDVAAIQAPSDWTADRVKVLHDTVLSRMIPRGTANPGIVSEKVLPMQIGGMSAYEICFTYARFAQQFEESVVFVEHGKTQLQIHFGSLKQDFADLHAAFLGSLFTLRGF
jgi:hypothetical protein